MRRFHAHMASLNSLQCATCSERFPGLRLCSLSTECVRCSHDKHSPKVYSATNNMDPGPIPPQLQVGSCTRTVLVEIIRDSKNKYFFQRSRIIMVEISRSRIIRITNYSARTCARKSSRDLYREPDDDVVEPEVEKERLNRQSRVHCLPDKFRHLRGATWTVSVRKDVQTARR